MAQHPAVVEAAAFAVEDEMYGQHVGIAVRVVEGEDVDAVVRGRVAALRCRRRWETFLLFVLGWYGSCVKKTVLMGCGFSS